MMRHGWLGHVEALGQVARRHLLAPEQAQDFAAGRIGQGFEDRVVHSLVAARYLDSHRSIVGWNVFGKRGRMHGERWHGTCSRSLWNQFAARLTRMNVR